VADGGNDLLPRPRGAGDRGAAGIETVALLAEANIESLRRLTELPEGTPVGVVGWGQTCMENLSRSIEGRGLDHLRFVQSTWTSRPTKCWRPWKGSRP
jgi:hypothetical protein